MTDINNKYSKLKVKKNKNKNKKKNNKKKNNKKNDKKNTVLVSPNEKLKKEKRKENHKNINQKDIYNSNNNEHINEQNNKHIHLNNKKNKNKKKKNVQLINEKWINKKKKKKKKNKSNNIYHNNNLNQDEDEKKKKNVFPYVSVLGQNVVNKNIHIHRTNDDHKYDYTDLQNNKQKYKKKKKIEKNPEDIVNSSLFRYINEYMYTNNSSVVENKLNQTKNIFNIYHQGYKNQKNKWPHNPVSVIIKHLKKNFNMNNKIADLGCGEAEIARTLDGWDIISFDLIQYNDYITPCNITQLPLNNNSYDCFVLSLSLMNTDWPKIIFESVRCLKKGASLIIAEVVSRFTNYKAFIKFMNNVGFKLSNKINLDDFFYVFFFEKNQDVDISSSTNEKRIKKVSSLLTPCIYKRR
ncbi:rRNA processing and telomere maintaining methyltransferase, putative [Plasmodium sp. gorilla clade G2]|uniref:rRNA processing and telomere maintaining methyltransferase, putative n=1 Tax=Plasmodium sp. gorilla clade G2 TaxID=880535 RepID=UPI000D2152B8|nr:rRNA processing and telomere maintaining methyltransferase, putative [Plasmodium sp. gorilla clade G2]SOV14392.1 rRNA processing and telomere maintaining methyltransferase, putative [Plasmodium sp. gorilla clade G2]